MKFAWRKRISSRRCLFVPPPENKITLSREICKNKKRKTSSFSSNRVTHVLKGENERKSLNNAKFFVCRCSIQVIKWKWICIWTRQQWRQLWLGLRCELQRRWKLVKVQNFIHRKPKRREVSDALDTFSTETFSIAQIFLRYGSMEQPVKPNAGQYKVQPGRIEHYTPGKSSISDKEAKQVNTNRNEQHFSAHFVVVVIFEFQFPISPSSLFFYCSDDSTKP